MKFRFRYWLLLPAAAAENDSGGDLGGGQRFRHHPGVEVVQPERHRRVAALQSRPAALQERQPEPHAVDHLFQVRWFGFHFGN